MGRPAIKEEKRRIQTSISVGPDISDLAKLTSNQSHFYETSVQVASGMSKAMRRLKNSRGKYEDVMEELYDLAAVWEAEFEETVPWDDIKDSLLKRRK